jgi:polar amino acid transport system substrate-binding protein
VYYEDLAVALDQKSPMPSESLRQEIDRAVQQMHQDGTLTTLSNKYYGIDLTKKK